MLFAFGWGDVSVQEALLHWSVCCGWKAGRDGGLRLWRHRTNCEGKFSLITLVVLTLHGGGYCSEGFSCLRSSA